MELPVLVRSLKSSIASSTSFQTGKTFWGVLSAAVEQSRRKANMVTREIRPLRLTPGSLQTQKNKYRFSINLTTGQAI